MLLDIYFGTTGSDDAFSLHGRADMRRFLWPEAFADSQAQIRREAGHVPGPRTLVATLTLEPSVCASVDGWRRHVLGWLRPRGLTGAIAPKRVIVMAAGGRSLHLLECQQVVGWLGSQVGVVQVSVEGPQLDPRWHRSQDARRLRCSEAGARGQRRLHRRIVQ